MVEFPLRQLRVPHSFCGPICTSQCDHTNHCFTSLVPIEPYTLVCIGGDLHPIVAIPKLGFFTRSPTQPGAPSAKGSINACRIALPGSACGATLCDQKMMPLLYVQPLQPLWKKTTMNHDEPLSKCKRLRSRKWTVDTWKLIECVETTSHPDFFQEIYDFERGGSIHSATSSSNPCQTYHFR